MRNITPVEKLPEKLKWRDFRLMELAKHKQEVEDKSTKPQ